MPGSKGIVATVVYAFQHSDLVAQCVVLVLLALSAYVWITMLEKALRLREVNRRNQRFKRDFFSSNPPQNTTRLTGQHAGPLAELARTARAEQLHQAGFDPEQHSSGPLRAAPALAGPIPEQQAESVRERMSGQVGRQVNQLESRLNTLGTVVSISPFLGLLGTVWGVMRAFTGMAVAGSTDIQVMAPGVSGALLTTVVGLLVAIPAVVGYNLLSQAVQQQVRDMDNFVDDFIYHLRQTSGSAPTAGTTAARGERTAQSPSGSVQY